MTEISSESHFCLISSESQFFSGNIANMIPESPLNNEQNGTTHGGSWGGGGGGVAHGLYLIQFHYS